MHFPARLRRPVKEILVPQEQNQPLRRIFLTSFSRPFCPVLPFLPPMCSGSWLQPIASAVPRIVIHPLLPIGWDLCNQRWDRTWEGQHRETAPLSDPLRRSEEHTSELQSL